MLTLNHWNSQDIDDFLSLRLPEAETRRLLAEMHPDRIEPDFFKAVLNAMRAKTLPLAAINASVMDCCGTGGSGLARFNASTTAAFIMAAGGVPVVKFGNRGMRSRSGSFDLLERLGIPSNWTLSALPDVLEDCDLVFLYAPQIYPELAPFSQFRRAVGGQTIFNYMGPLLNPVKPTYRLTGVSHAGMQELLAELLRDDPKIVRAWVVRAESTLDEIAHDGCTTIFDIDRQTMKSWTYQPEFVAQAFDPTLTHTVEENEALFQAIISGVDGHSAYHRISCLNAGAGFFLAGKAASLEDGVLMAEDLLVNGKVQEQVDKVRRIYARLH